MAACGERARAGTDLSPHLRELCCIRSQQLLALPGKSFAPHQICPLSEGQETDPERAKGAH